MKQVSKIAVAALLSGLLYLASFAVPALAQAWVFPVALLVTFVVAVPVLLFVFISVLTVIEKLVYWRRYTWREVGREYGTDIGFILKETRDWVVTDVKLIATFPKFVLDKVRT